jgi:hypothetical protein
VTVQLLATELGRPVYERLGFVAEAEYRTLAGPPAPRPAAPGGAPAAGVRAGRPADRAAVLALDRLATGEDRSRLLDALWPAGGLVAGDGHPRGFHLASPWRNGGATVAGDPDAGLALLEAVRRGDSEEVSVSLPAGNRAGLLALAAAGFRERSGTTRMCLGPPLPWRPESVFGAHNLFWG